MMYQAPDFTKIALGKNSKPASLDEWKRQLEQETGVSMEDLYYRTMEQIQLKPLYSAEDLAGMNHLAYMAGIPPFLRGTLLHHVCE